jgi:hypothetical protein
VLKQYESGEHGNESISDDIPLFHNSRYSSL